MFLFVSPGVQSLDNIAAPRLWFFQQLSSESRNTAAFSGGKHTAYSALHPSQHLSSESWNTVASSGDGDNKRVLTYATTMY
ncbi:hypothetical protein E2C01_027824 [Portunus trituberculatus]|uniref:Uncharacterized protein n=1 Tax=Portunus trituberculatus TaxID=210409 RepID=A0A5B7EJN8_PORTR|nr:hypothetical protein [Portunus trituberculatus]